jgi:hypothetical protein
MNTLLFNVTKKAIKRLKKEREEDFKQNSPPNKKDSQLVVPKADSRK